MDLYIKNFHPGGTHDLFYTDPTIIKAFKDYLSHVVPRYANNPAVLGWELGNDLRCSSTLRPSLAICIPSLSGSQKYVSQSSKMILMFKVNSNPELQQSISRASIPITL